MKPMCLECGKAPSGLTEYVTAAREYEITPDEYVRREEGTYNPQTGFFWCTECYIKIGMPLGKA